MLTNAQVEDFHRNGYVAVRGVVPTELLATLRAQADSWLECARARTRSDEMLELAAGHCLGSPRLRRVHHPVANSDAYWDVATSDAVLDCVAALIGEDVRFHHSKLNMKSEKGGVAIGWHQDFAFFPHSNTDLIACGIALDDASSTNGCLMVIPGSHRLGPLEHHNEHGQFCGQIVSKGAFDAGTAVPVGLKAGDMSIHHVCTVHGSSVNASDQPRRLFICQYAAADAVQLDFRRPANIFSNRIVRGDGATHARLEVGSRVRLRGELGGGCSIFEQQKKEAVYGAG